MNFSQCRPRCSVHATRLIIEINSMPRSKKWMIPTKLDWLTLLKEVVDSITKDLVSTATTQWVLIQSGVSLQTN